MNRKKFETLFANSYGNKKSSMSKQQAANIVKQVVVSNPNPNPNPSPTPLVITKPVMVDTGNNNDNKIIQCSGCNKSIIIKPTTIKKQITKEQFQFSVVKVPYDVVNGSVLEQKHQCKYKKCKRCGEYIYFDPKQIRLVRESEKDRIRSDIIQIPLNKRNNKKHRCVYGSLPKNETCGHCGANIFWHRLYYDDAQGQFIPLRKETLRPHICGQDNEQEGIIIGAYRLSYHEGYEH